MELKWLFFPKKLQELPSSWELGSQTHSDSLFSRTQSSQPTTLKIDITMFLNKQLF